MRNFYKIPAYIITFVILAAAMAVFVFNIQKISLPPDFIEYESGLVKDEINVYKNTHGITHIIAEREEDVFHAMGYVHAQDRLWQMDFNRRFAQGRLSEILGEETISADIFMRAVGIEDIADSIAGNISDKSLRLYHAYCNGINEYISRNKDRLPFEFAALDYVPEDFEPSDCIAIGRKLAFELSISMIADLALSEIAMITGVSKAMELVPGFPADAPHVTDEKTNLNNYYLRRRDYHDDFSEADRKIIKKTLENVYQKIRNAKELLGVEGSSLGSNSWAIRNDDSDTTAAVLANDPHLPVTLPPHWYQLQTTSPEYNVVGLTYPGIPGFLIGRNNKIAWGITNMMIDDADFFIEKVDTVDSDYYFDHTGSRRKFIYVKDTISIRENRDSIFYLRFTDRSAVVSDYHILRDPEMLIDIGQEEISTAFFERYAITFEWTGKLESEEMAAIYGINTAGNWKEFSKALSHWGVPGQNFTYADIHGNVGIKPAGYVPKRGEDCNPNITNPGWMEEFFWKGHYSTSDLPDIYNPEKGYVSSANNKTSRNPDFFISNYWEPHSRASRIEELLDESGSYSYRDAQLMQMDNLSPYAFDLLRKSLPLIVDDTAGFSKNEKLAFQMLLNWDFIISAGTPVSSVFNAFLERIINNTFYDELSERLYREYTFINSISLRKINELLDERSSHWFDNIFTEEKETAKDIVLLSFKESVDILSEIFDTDDIYEWKYGKIHTITLKHAFSENDFLRPTVTHGPYPGGGNSTTINNMEWRIYNPFEIVISVSGRFIADMSDSTVYACLPGGASGDPMSPNYADQIQLWLNGGYLQLKFSDTPGEEFKLQTRIIPASL